MMKSKGNSDVDVADDQPHSCDYYYHSPEDRSSFFSFFSGSDSRISTGSTLCEVERDPAEPVLNNMRFGCDSNR